MDTGLRALIVEESQSDAEALITALEEGGYRVGWERVDTPDGMSAALDEHPWDVILADYTLPELRGLEALALLRRRDVDMPFIIVADAIEEDDAVVALKLGAQDCVMRTHLARLVPAVERALREAEERRVRRETEAALRASEERYRMLVENANDVVFTTDLHGNFTSLNKAGELISGYTRSEVRRMNMAQVLTAESLAVAQDMIRQKLSGTRTTTYELEMIAKDGHHVSLEASTRLVTHGGRPVGIQGIARDITERKRSAEALGESEARYRGLFENASDLVYTHDLEGNFTSINEAVRAVTGYSREEALALNLSQVVAPDHVGLARQMTRAKLEGGGPTTYELDIIMKDGRRKALEINSQLIFQHGEPLGVQGIARDVTERRSREEKQAAVAELGQQALASTDLDALFRDATRCVTETLEVEYCTVLELVGDGTRLLSRAGLGWRSGVIGRESVQAGPHSQAGYALLSSEPVFMDDLSAETRFSIPRVLTDHEVSSGLSVIIHGPSRPFGVLSAFSRSRRAFSQDDAHFLRSVANVLATAIQRSRLEEERAQHSKELATRVLQAHEAERKRIARELHDETAQSLSVLLTNLDLLESHIPEDGPLRAGFERMGQLARRALDETRALSHDLRPTILDDAGLVAALQWVAAEFEQSYGGSVHFETSGEQREDLSAEMELALFRIAQEGLTNIGKHAGASDVWLSLSFPDSCARLVVRDNGRGFDPKNVSRPTRQGRLGLYGMQERAALLGGTLNIKASPGKGTQVIVEIPVAAEEE